MGFAYIARDQFAVHYVTFTVHQWVDVFTRQAYRDILVDSINCKAILTAVRKGNSSIQIFLIAEWVRVSTNLQLLYS